MCRMCGGRGCGRCQGYGLRRQERPCSLYPGPGIDPRGVSCNVCLTKPKNCNGPPYGCPNVNYYPCGFGGKTYSCRVKEPWDIRHLNYLWNYNDCCCCNGQGRGSGHGPCNGSCFNSSDCPPPHPDFPRLNKNGAKDEGDGAKGGGKSSETTDSAAQSQTETTTEQSGALDSWKTKTGGTGGAGSTGGAASDADPCMALILSICKQMSGGGAGKDAADPCAGFNWSQCAGAPQAEDCEESDEEDCEEDEVVTAADVSKYLDKIQSFVMAEVRGDDKHTLRCIRDLVNLRINVLGTASSLAEEGETTRKKKKQSGGKNQGTENGKSAKGTNRSTTQNTEAANRSSTPKTPNRNASKSPKTQNRNTSSAVPNRTSAATAPNRSSVTAAPNRTSVTGATNRNSGTAAPNRNSVTAAPDRSSFAKAPNPQK